MRRIASKTRLGPAHVVAAHDIFLPSLRKKNIYLIDQSIHVSVDSPVPTTGQVPKTLKSNAEKKTGSKVAI